MYKTINLIVLFLICSGATALIAQNKFAVLVAVNNYYDDPGVKSSHSLNGCVNDANAMKGLLLNRFGFTPDNIYTLYNEKVIKKNFIDLLQIMLHKCKPGDALVFYYSGHGVWMDNRMNASDKVKRGMSQAIVMSNLYASNWDCLVRDETLKKIFNQFVDKKITVTTVFDCCYSANLLMMPQAPRYWTDATPIVEKSIDLSNITYASARVKPTGCKVDSTGKLIDTLDTDLDGVPDCDDWEIHTPPRTVVNYEGVRNWKMTEEEFLGLPDSYYNPSKFAKDSTVINNDLTNSAGDTRGYNMKDAIKMSYKSTQLRPTDRINSGFLSISGTSDTKPGLEITDDAGMKHGAFTKALLTVYKENRADLPVSELLDKINAHMLQQEYYQNPTPHAEPGRRKGNLIGTVATGFSKTIKAVCTSSKAGIITIDKGHYAGVANGNIFTNVSAAGKPQMQIIKVTNESATAVARSNSRIKKGDIVELTDPYTISSPLVKICIPSTHFTPVGFNDFFNRKIKPWVKLPNYGDYNFWDDQSAGTLVFCDDAANFRKVYYNPGKKHEELLLMYIFLPIPSYITDACKNILMKNQNIEIVNDVDKADYVLYLNYIKARPGTKDGFVFYLHPPMAKTEEYNSAIFSRDHIKVPSLNSGDQSLQVISKKISELSKRTIRYKTTAWMNTYPKR